MTMLPAASEATGSSITEGQFKTWLTSLRTFLYEKLGDDGSVAIQAFAAGTKMLFQQTSAPTGWTKDTTHNDKALRVVSGTASSGGTSAFSTVFGKTATDGRTLTAAEMPSHSHSYPGVVGTSEGAGSSGTYPAVTSYPFNSGGSILYVSAFDYPQTSASGSGGSHSHNIDLRVQYVDLIIATKD